MSEAEYTNAVGLGYIELLPYGHIVMPILYTYDVIFIFLCIFPNVLIFEGFHSLSNRYYERV